LRSTAGHPFNKKEKTVTSCSILKMNRLILFGSTGNLGKKVAEEATRRGYAVTAAVRNESKAVLMQRLGVDTVVADVTSPSSLKGICNGFDIVVSTLGKSVSPNEKSKPSFLEIDLAANANILNEAVKAKAQKFVYVSALGAERLTHLDYFKAHHQFSEQLGQSGIDYTIIKPPALFSAFVDLIELAKKGRLVTMGKGDKLTNPIYEGDLAKLIVDGIQQSNAIIEAGGKEILSRQQINDIIQTAVNPGKKVRTVPMGVVKSLLPLIKLFSKNMYDKVAFFTAVMDEDVLAPPVGDMRLKDYVRLKTAGT
jgi:uncharacterized protein YbjT (DUF2867 family)